MRVYDICNLNQPDDSNAAIPSCMPATIRMSKWLMKVNIYPDSESRVMTVLCHMCHKYKYYYKA